MIQRQLFYSTIFQISLLLTFETTLVGHFLSQMLGICFHLWQKKKTEPLGSCSIYYLVLKNNTPVTKENDAFSHEGIAWRYVQKGRAIPGWDCGKDTIIPQPRRALCTWRGLWLCVRLWVSSDRLRRYCSTESWPTDKGGPVRSSE